MTEGTRHWRWITVATGQVARRRPQSANSFRPAETEAYFAIEFSIGLWTGSVAVISRISRLLGDRRRAQGGLSILANGTAGGVASTSNP